MNNNNQTEIEINQEDTLNLRQALENYSSKWFWFLLSIIICLTLSYFYIKYQQPIYEAKATLLIDKERNNTFSQLSSVEDIFSAKDEVEDEIIVIKSLSLIENVVKKLHLDVNYYRLTNYSKKISEYYNNSPIIVTKTYENNQFQGNEILITLINSHKFKISINDNTIGAFSFGQDIKINENVHIKVEPNEMFFTLDQKEIYIQLKSLEQTTSEYSDNLVIEPYSKTSNVLNLSFQSNNLQKSKDILNTVIEQYSLNSIDDKRELAIKTEEFIRERIIDLNKDLKGIEKNIENFKKENKLTDIVTEAQQYSKASFDAKDKIFENEIQLSLVKYLAKDIDKNDLIALPSNLGLNDQTIASSIQQYNEAVLSKKKFNNSTTELNPEYRLVSQQVAEYKKGIKASLQNQINNLEISLKNLYAQDGFFNRNLQSMPEKERQYREIFRQQQTKEALFLFLLQKGEEVGISQISVQPNSKTINNAFGKHKPVSPKKKIIYSIGLILGFLLPFIIIYLLEILDSKIHSIEDLEKYTKIPILGSVFKHKFKNRILLDVNDRTSVGESFRVLITNLEFSLSNNKNSKTILLTSTLSGEGKSFISANLANFLANLGHKTVLVGLDMRAPKLNEFFDYLNPKGITHYIKDENLQINEIKTTSKDNPNLDIITSGIILPNFIDVLKNNRLKHLISELRNQYDYIIIDSAPVGLVSDTLNVSNYVDLCLYVVRANFLDKRYLSIINKIKLDNRFTDIKIILNDINGEKSHYGYGYGYGFSQDKYIKYKFWKKECWKYWFEKINY